MNPPPDVLVCLDCGWSEFSIPRAWLAAGWLRERTVSVPSVAAINAANVIAAAS